MNTSIHSTGGLPPEFGQMHQKATLPLGPDWFEQQGVPMVDGEAEPGFPERQGTVHTSIGPLVVIGAPGDDAVGVWAHKDAHPQTVVDALQQTFGYDAEPLHVSAPPEAHET